MKMELSQRIIAKVSGPAWELLRGQFLHIARMFLAVSPETVSELLTTYVKFSADSSPEGPVYAVAWIKNSKRLMVGLSLPAEYEAEGLVSAPPGTTYKGLTKYFIVEPGGTVPPELAAWAKMAYRNAIVPIALADLAKRPSIKNIAPQTALPLQRAG
jgi:hypothetical protein